ncbi:hypothetical protein M1N66_03495 [Thermodesulfovibrionales bacterium]|nr:hypothetical protein [Thermodesulfovibrionales bacterium]
MALVINTNIPSLMAQRNILENMTPLQQAMERLSSGLRINNAADDAAGLAIATRMTAQISGMVQAIRNTNDGVSLTQTAEGSLVEITDNLQRIRVLAVQAASATVTDAERETMQVEVDQLIAEIGRVAGQSNFNAVNLLDGTFKNKAFQVGANTGETITIDAIVDARTTELGSRFEATSTTTVNTAPIVASNLTINGVRIVDSVDDGSGAEHAKASALAKATAINATSGVGVVATAETRVTGSIANVDGATQYSLTINGVAIHVDARTANNPTAEEIVIGINAAYTATGVRAEHDAVAGTITLTAADGRNITITEEKAPLPGATGGIHDDIADDAGRTFTGEITLTATNAAITVGGTPELIGNPGAAEKRTGIDDVSIATVGGAKVAIIAIDNALAEITSGRGALGAIQNRFMSTISDLQVTVENLTASRSRIMDADFAAETANMTKAMIIQQSGISVLAQANIMPQNILALLG